MAYRDDLEAARHQIDQLEGRVREARLAGEQREQQLRSRIDELEAELGRSRHMSRAQLWLVCWMPTAVTATLYVAAVGSAMTDHDDAAWALAQLAIIAGMFSTAWSWGRRGNGAPLAGFVALKIAIPTAWGWGWWHPLYSGLPHASYGTPLYFFWCAPLVILAIVVAEGFLIRRGLRPLGPQV